MHALDKVKLKYEHLPTDPKRKPKKVLTNVKTSGIMDHVKAKRKDNKMASTENKKSKSALKTTAWFSFAVQQGFVGYMLLANFDNYVVMVAAGVSVLMAVSVVLWHMYRANK